MAWRRPNEGLKYKCTAKGSHEGTGGKVAHFFAAIVCGKGITLCEQYHACLLPVQIPRANYLSKIETRSKIAGEPKMPSMP